VAEIQTIAASKRERAGKGSSRATRRDGRIPAVIYGGSQPPELISVGGNDLTLKYHKGGFKNTLFKVDVEGTIEQVLPRDVQTHPVTDRIIHVDFFRVGSDTRITIDVPVHFSGMEQSPGIKRGGVLNVVRHEVELWCPATSIPERLEANLSGLEIGDGIHIHDIALPEGVTPVIRDRNFTIATIAAPSTGEKEVAEAAEGEAAEGAEGAEGAAAEGAEGDAKKPEAKKADGKKDD
jgi:large subunit ribosomal protein L25